MITDVYGGHSGGKAGSSGAHSNGSELSKSHLILIVTTFLFQGLC